MDSARPETDLRKEAERRSALECKNRIRTLREMRRQWRNEDPRTLDETKEEHWKMLNVIFFSMTASFPKWETCSGQYDIKGRTYKLMRAQ